MKSGKEIPNASKYEASNQGNIRLKRTVDFLNNLRLNLIVKVTYVVEFILILD